MTQEEKQLLLVDLCARLLYGVYAELPNHHLVTHTYYINKIGQSDGWTEGVLDCAGRKRFYAAKIEDIKPYLRPMSSMTEEERKEFSKLLVKRYCEEDWEGHISTSYCIEIDNVYTDDENGIKYPSPFSMDAIDWLNVHHFDYRGLIEKGLVITVTEENDPYKD